MNSWPVFTLITVTYMAGKVLKPTLRSVAMQDYPGLIRHLIVDGASTDDTPELAERYRLQTEGSDSALPREVTFTSSKDRGIYDAMNKGLQQVDEGYVCFLNAGDELACKSTITELASAARAATEQGRQWPGVVYGKTDIIDADGIRLGERHLQPRPNLTWRNFREGMLICHQAFYARADLARQTAFDLHYRYSADYDWCINVMRLAERVGAPLAFADTTVACFLDAGTTKSHHRASLVERLRIMARQYGWPVAVAQHVKFALGMKR